MLFIVMTGLPGTGKTSIGEAIARTLNIPIFAKDWLESSLRRASFDENCWQHFGYVGYELLTTLALRQLQLGQSVILDSVATTESIRKTWRDLAYSYQATWRVIECICSDEAAHQARLVTRQRGIPDWDELTWAQVIDVKTRFVTWHEPRLILDAVNPPENNIQRALAYVIQ
jgi:predicted kinase